jgi:excisionase family DNA binding protein
MGGVSGYTAPMPGPELLTRAELMDYLRISRGTLDKLIKNRVIPFIKLDQKVLFRKSEVDRWLESKTIKAHRKS